MLLDRRPFVQRRNLICKEAFPISTTTHDERSGLLHNPWKYAFLILFSLVLAVVITLVSCWMWVTHPKQPVQSDTQAHTGGVPIAATVSLTSINQLLDMQVVKQSTPVRDAELLFEGEQQRVRINTQLTFFGRAMEMAVWMKPHVQPNGNLRLVADDARMGQWPIPLKTLFAVLEGLPWPPWVHVQAEQHVIDFNLSERHTTNGTLYKVKKIDWAKQDVQLDVLIATEPQPLQK